MKNHKWIWIALVILFIAALAVTIVLVNRWYLSGNVRTTGQQVRVDLSGKAYIFEHETGEMLGETMMTLYGETKPGNLEVFDGWMNIMNMEYMNEYDGVLTTTMGVLEGEDGYMEIHVHESCTHVETNDRGTKEEVTHACKYTYEFYVHPDMQDFLVARVKDSYALYPVWILTTKYRDKLYTFAMNGQTGKFVGNLPIDWVRFAAWLSGVTLGGGLLAYLAGMLLGLI